MYFTITSCCIINIVRKYYRNYVVHLKEIQYLLEVVVYATLSLLFALGGVL